MSAPISSKVVADVTEARATPSWAAMMSEIASPTSIGEPSLKRGGGGCGRERSVMAIADLDGPAPTKGRGNAPWAEAGPASENEQKLARQQHRAVRDGFGRARIFRNRGMPHGMTVRIG